ncbi:hypothetical protein B0H11DRAFT_1970224 [Mycena galericulata]|nr:hypothetical protein B0H11DRAFT_1970224 [Mycena galericulata]
MIRQVICATVCLARGLVLIIPSTLGDVSLSLCICLVTYLSYTFFFSGRKYVVSSRCPPLLDSKLGQGGPCIVLPLYNNTLGLRSGSNFNTLNHFTTQERFFRQIGIVETVR